MGRLSSGAAAAAGVTKQKPAAAEDTEEGDADNFGDLDDFQLQEETDESLDPESDNMAAFSSLGDPQNDWEELDEMDEESDAFGSEAAAGQLRCAQ